MPSADTYCIDLAFRKRGFSLVELSIVLVILGLLVGGILAGKSLIRASELRSITTQFDQFATAHRAFRDKYFGVPGDITNATQFWGAADPTPANCYPAMVAGTTGTKTCNGDGNGYPDQIAMAKGDERALYWQHLSNAGLIAGSYSGVGRTAAFCCYAIPANSPRGRLSTSLWNVYGAATLGPISLYYTFGAQTPAFGDMPAYSNYGAILRAEELWNIDKKIDDGMPNTGKVEEWNFSYNWITTGAGGPMCATGSAVTDTYVLNGDVNPFDGSDVTCAPLFVLQ